MEENLEEVIGELKQIENTSNELKDSEHSMYIQLIVSLVLIIKIAILIVKEIYDKKKSANEKVNEKKETEEMLHNISKNIREVKELSSSRHIETKNSEENIEKEEDEEEEILENDKK